MTTRPLELSGPEPATSPPDRAHRAVLVAEDRIFGA
jgi:hypothetical protein